MSVSIGVAYAVHREEIKSQNLQQAFVSDVSFVILSLLSAKDGAVFYVEAQIIGCLVDIRIVGCGGVVASVMSQVQNIIDLAYQ